MKGDTKRGDFLRIRALCNTIIEPFSEMEHMSVEDKLHAAFVPESVPLFRRKFIRSTKVQGAWWMDEDQWTRFLWAGYDGNLVRDPIQDKVITTRSFAGGSWAYIRVFKDRVDIESRTQSAKWCPERKVDLGRVWEWITVTITPEEYKRISINLGPEHDGCNHKED